MFSEDWADSEQCIFIEQPRGERGIYDRAVRSEPMSRNNSHPLQAAAEQVQFRGQNARRQRFPILPTIQSPFLFISDSDIETKGTSIVGPQEEGEEIYLEHRDGWYGILYHLPITGNTRFSKAGLM